MRGTAYHPAVEREILFTGIGGQGVQLAARTLAEAAVADGRRVQLFASYGGMMRGGNSDSVLVVADEAVRAPPMVSSAWGAVVMHHEHAALAWSIVRPGGPAVVNSSIVAPEALEGRSDISVIPVAALDRAGALGAPMAASLVLVGVLAAATGLVSEDALLSTPERVLPSYRREAAAANRQALADGLSLVTLTHPAWSADPVST